MNLNDLFAIAEEHLPESVTSVLDSAAEMIPSNVDFVSVLRLILFVAAISLVIGVVGRVGFGKHSDLNRAVSSSIGILFFYVLTVVVYTFRPWSLDAYLSPLPFTAFRGELLYLLPLSGTPFNLLCSRILDLVILAFLVNLLDVVMPRGESFLGWLLLRVAGVLAFFFLYFFLTGLIGQYLPNVLATYAPMILLGILLCLLLLGILNAILSALVIAVNPILGAIYTFFFGNLVGKQLTKSVLTTGILTGVLYFLEKSGYTVINVSATSLPAYLPLVAALLGLWYLLGRVL